MLKQRIELWTGREEFRQRVQAVQFDSGRTLECVVMDAAVPEGAMAHFFTFKPSGKKVYLDCTVSGNTVSVDLPNQALAETGSLPCQIEIFDGDQKRISSFEFTLEVKKTLITDEILESTDALDALNSYVEAAKNSADAAEKSNQEAGTHAQTATQDAQAAAQSRTAAEDAKTKAEAARDKAVEAQSEAEQARGEAQTAGETATSQAEAAKGSAAAAEASNKAAAASAEKAETARTAAETARDEAGKAQSAAETAKGEAQTAAETATGKAQAASESADAARNAQTAAEAAKKGAEDAKGAAAASAADAQNWTNQSRSWAVGEGYEERENQGEDNSRYYAQQAKASNDAVQALSEKLTTIAGGEIVTQDELKAAVEEVNPFSRISNIEANHIQITFNQTEAWKTDTQLVYQATRNCFAFFAFHFPSFKEYRYCDIALNGKNIERYGSEIENAGQPEFAFLPVFMLKDNRVQVSAQTKDPSATTVLVYYYIL